MDGIDEQPLKGIKVVMGTTDVHEFGKEICKSIVQKAGATVVDMGATVAPAQLIAPMLETESHILLVSTYNGIAYSFGKELVKKLDELDIHVPIVMGGRLNEPMEGSHLPVDVSDRLAEMKINVDNDIDKIVNYLVESLAV